MLVKVVLEALVGKVDAELFKAVVLIILKAKDVQDSYGQNLMKKRQTARFSHLIEGEKKDGKSFSNTAITVKVYSYVSDLY